MRAIRRHRSLPALVLLLMLGMAACGPAEGPEARLRGTLATLEEAAEAGDRGAFMAHVADDFAGQGGSLDRGGLADFFRLQLLAHTRVRVVLSNVRVELVGDRARATFDALATGGPRAWLPESGQLYEVATGWRQGADGWLLISADWRPRFGG